MTPVGNRTIALAGLYQSVDLVSQIARRGIADSASVSASLTSIFKLDAESYADVFGGTGGVETGLRVLREQLTADDRKSRMERTRYVVTLLYLERKLRRSSSMAELIQQGIAQARQQLAHYDVTHINVINRLADVYQQTVSPLRPAIIVQGDQAYLANPQNASRVRALLLAGMRAAVLWRQAGGTRWRLFIGREALLRDVEALLANAQRA